MATRDLFINGESMVLVRGPSGSNIATVQQLGLCEGPVRVRLNFRHDDVNIDAWGEQVPFDIQTMLADAIIDMDLLHVAYDATGTSQLDECLRLSMGGGSNTIGRVSRAGKRLGGATGSVQYAAGTGFIALGIMSPVAGKPWTFPYTYLTGSPVEIPLGTKRSVIRCQWRAIPATDDPWGNAAGMQPNTAAGTGADEAVLWHHTQLT